MPRRRSRTNVEQSCCAEAAVPARRPTSGCVGSSRYHAAGNRCDAETAAEDLLTSCWYCWPPGVTIYCAVGCYSAAGAGCRASGARVALKLCSYGGAASDEPPGETRRNTSCHWR